ncbi:MAG: thiamine-phosphate kinase, partial [Mariprofundaceae bacterium]|nr:thiamine-phosphate kinase [Mariprofundaceae bacterium]
EELAMQAMLSGGEDYALLLTAPPNISGLSSLAVKVGCCVEGCQLSVHLHGQAVMPKARGFDHFAS